MQEKLTYEQAIQRLETMAAQMEHDEIGIDEMAERLSQAQQLLKYCREKLYDAEQKCNALIGIEEEEKA